jgi:hypothetical protein
MLTSMPYLVRAYCSYYCIARPDRKATCTGLAECINIELFFRFITNTHSENLR